MLMVSVMEVINVSWSNRHAEQYQFEEDELNRKRQLRNSCTYGRDYLSICYAFRILYYY